MDKPDRQNLPQNLSHSPENSRSSAPDHVSGEPNTKLETQNPKPSSDYHDYFIKNGRFIGRFEEMYQNVPDPWQIQALGRRLDMDAALLLLQRFRRDFTRTLDVGCGRGFFTNLLARTITGRIYASDVSPTAIRQARDKYPDPRLEFFAFDLAKIEELAFPIKNFDLIVMAQTIWCVLPDLTRILSAFRRMLKPDGCLLISQHFPRPEDQKYGREILAGPDGLIRMLDETGFRIMDTLETNRWTNHHLALLAQREAAWPEPFVKPDGARP